MSEKKVYWPVVVAVVSVIAMMFFIILLSYFTSQGASVGILSTIMEMQRLFRTLMMEFLGSRVLLEAMLSGLTFGILGNVTGVP